LIWSGVAPKLPSMCGVATLTMVMSSTSRTAVSTTATTSATEGRLVGASTGGAAASSIGRRTFSLSDVRVVCWSVIAWMLARLLRAPFTGR
jgi:cysteine synthase